MKKFLIGSLFGMVIALVSVVVVWWYLQQSMVQTDEQREDEPAALNTSDMNASEPVEEGEAVSAEASAVTAETQPVPVNELPLTPEQRQLAESFGLDVTQMTLSPELITCARETLGESRYQAILAGDTPGVLETARLVPCLGR
jgi:hypothetical protein